MSEERRQSFRLFKIAKELNVAISTMAEFLASKGYAVNHADPNAKISGDMYAILKKEYDSDKKSKEKATHLKQLQKDAKTTVKPAGRKGGDEAHEMGELLYTAEELKNKVKSEVAANDLLAALKPPAPPVVEVPPSVAPAGPTSEPAIESLLREAPAATKSAVSEKIQELVRQAEDVVRERAEEAVAIAVAVVEAPPPIVVAQPPAPPVVETPPAPIIAAEATPPAPDKPPPAPPVKETPPAPQAEEATSPFHLKVVGKIDLDNIDSRTGRRKDAPKPQQPPQQQQPPPKQKAKEKPKQPNQPNQPNQPPKDRRPGTPSPVAEKSNAEHPKAAKRPQESRPEAETARPPKINAPARETAAPPVVEEIILPVAVELPAVVEEIEEHVIRAADHAPKLTGLTILGKIELPSARPPKGKGVDPKAKDAKDKGVRPVLKKVGDEKPDSEAGLSEEEKRKRKRKRKRKTTDVAAPAASAAKQPAKDSKDAKDKGRPGVGGKKPREAVSARQVKDNIKTTLFEIGKTGSRKRQTIRKEKRARGAAQRQQAEIERMEQSHVLEVTEFLTANELANLMDVSVNEVIGKCMELGLIVSINQRINADVISLIAEEFGYEVRFLSPDETFALEIEEEDEALLFPRAPIVTVMGHVDHGKTSLLDHIRKSNVIAGEAGGITQHIGAYEVELDNGKCITFLDTPGHEAFTAMRARGAQVTDVAIIVIAADDQVMPQTREAINHAQAAEVPMVFAINKVDKAGSNTERIREQLAQMNLLVEDWGGKYQCQEISAKFGQGINELLEKVLLEAEMLALKANPERAARGTVIEAQLDKGRGVVTTLLVQTGTLRIGDIVVANCHFGRVKAMLDERGKKIKEAGPSTPVQILGLDGVPQAGDKFQVMETEREARELSGKRVQLMREQTIRMQKHITLEEIARRSAAGDYQELNIIVKGDVDGSVEALADSLIKLSTEEVAVKIVMKGVGQISESDVLLASASNAVIVGFQVRPSANARKLVQQEAIDVRLYSVIYDAIDEIRAALEGLLKPKIVEEVVGVAEVRDVFRISKVGAIAGCMMTEGKINRNMPVRLVRDGIVQYTGRIGSLRRFKDDVREVSEGFECGIGIDGYNDIRLGDFIEAFTTVETKRTLN